MWELVDLRFEEEETKNVVSRDSLLDNHRLFETHTVATISNKGRVDFVPKIACISSPLYVIIAVNSQVFVLHENTFELVCSLSFDTFVDCLSLSDDSELLLVGEANGTLHILHVTSQTKLWSLPLVKKEEIRDHAFKSVLLQFSNEGLLKICVLACTEELFIFSNISKTDLYKAIETGCVNNIRNNIQRKDVCIPVELPSFLPKCLYENFVDEEHPVGLAGGGSLSFGVDADEDRVHYGFTVLNSCYDEEIVKAYCTRNGKHIIVLNSKHQLEILCSYTFVPIKLWDDIEVLDFIMQETVDPKSFAVSDCVIGLITCDGIGNLSSYDVYLFPSLEHIYSVSLSSYVGLAGCKPNQDCVYLIEGESDQSETDSLISSIHIKVVSESSFDARLSSLLHKRKFDEAENFAILQRLDTQIVYKTKINCLLEDLSSKIIADSTVDIDKIINELQDILFKVQDIAFIECCLSVRLPSLAQTKSFFTICRKWLEEHSTDLARKEKLMAQMNKILNKALTYEILSESNGLRNMQWVQFLLCDIRSRFMQELALGNMNTAFILWQRHQGDIMLALTVEGLDDILASIPDSVASNLLTPFLRDDFLPAVISNFPDALEKIAEWLIQRTYVLEISEKENWPENGKQLLEVFSTVCNNLAEGFDAGKICFSTNIRLHSIYKHSSNPSSPIHRLSVLVKSLEELKVLKKEYGCHLTLSEYCQTDKITVAYFMLDRVKPSLIEKAINKIIRNFVLKYNLDLDVCLVHYIKDVLQATPYTWWHWEEAPWEERILEIVKCIQDVDSWMDMTITVVFQAPIPWSVNIQKLVETGLELDHAKKDHLMTQSRLVGLKQTLMKYDLRHFPINGDVHLAKGLANYILRQAESSALEDIKNVYHAYENLLDEDAYMEQLKFLLKGNKPTEMLKLLISMPQGVATCCCQQLLTMITSILDNDFMLKHSKSEVQAHAEAGMLLMRFLKSVEAPVDPETCSYLSIFTKLQKEFNMYVPIRKFSSEGFCWRVVLEALNSFLKGEFFINQNFEGRKSVPTKPGLFHIYRLGDIFNLKREEVMTRMIHKFVEYNKFDQAVKLCKELVETYPSPSSADTLMTFVNNFFTEFENIKKLGVGTVIETIHHLVSIAVTHCSENVLKMPLWQHSSVLNTIRQLTMRETQFASLSVATSRSYQTWRFSPIYSDEGLWVDESKIELLVDKLYVTTQQLGLCENSTHDSDAAARVLKLAKELVGHARQKGQEIAALRVLMHSFSFAVSCVSQGSLDESSLQIYNFLLSVYEEMAFSILQKAIDKSNPDVPFILSALSMLPTPKVPLAFQRLVKWANTDLRRTLTLYSAAVKFAVEHDTIDMAQKFSKSYDKLSWFSRHSIPINSPQEVINFPYSEELNFIKDIIVCRNINLNAVFECCTIFRLDPDDILFIYLKNLLLGSEVKKWAKYPKLPHEKLSFILRRAEIVISEFKSKEFVLNCLKQILEEVNTYYYEILLFVHEQILKVSEDSGANGTNAYEKGITLLKFLLVYQRVAPPTESEVDEWVADNVMDGNLPVVANSRLPFHALMKGNVHKIINPELTVSTATVWSSLTSFLKLSPDEIIMIAVKNTVNKYIVQKKSSFDDQAVNFIPDMKFLSLLRELLGKIKDFEMALACANWVTNRMPSGANKVRAAHGAVLIANSWVLTSSCEKKILEAVKKLTRRHIRLAIEIVLYKYDLNNEEIFSLLQRPVQLIEHLVENYCIPVSSSVKVCQAIQEIADITELTVLDIYFGHLRRWMTPSQMTAQFVDESFCTVGPSLNMDSSEDTDRKNIQRAICLLLGVPPERRKELFRLLFANFTGMSTAHRARSLCCLLSVADPEFVSEITEHDYSTLMLELKLLMSVSELESMRLPYSMEMFNSCNKAELVERILTSRTHNQKALITCVKICLEYKLWQSHLWTTILLKMKSFFMIDELHNVLGSSSNNLPHIWHREEFKYAWQSVISSVLEKSSFEVESTEIITNTCSALLRCPGSALLDVSSISEKLKYCDMIPPHILNELRPDLNMCSFILILSQCISRKLANETLSSFFYTSDIEDDDDDNRKIDDDIFLPSI